jgi:hypothetical protein
MPSSARSGVTAGSSSRRASPWASRTSTTMPSASPSSSLLAASDLRAVPWSRARAERRLAEARLSDASGHRVPAIAARLTIRLCRARNASSRWEALGTRSTLPSQNRANPPRTLTMNLPCDPGSDSNPGMLPSRHLEADDLPQ